MGLQQVRACFVEFDSARSTQPVEDVLLPEEWETIPSRQINSSQWLLIKRYMAGLMLMTLDLWEEKEQKVTSILRRVPAGVVSQNAKPHSDLKTFLTGQALFRGGSYSASVKVLERFVKNKPHSPYIAKSLFLLVESYFLMNRYKECLTTIEKLVDLYPKNEFTGYALLRMAEIYRQRGRYSDAIEVYQTILKAFPYRALANQAREAMKL